MAKKHKVIEFEITPEQFLNACSPIELKEIELLIQSERFQKRMNCEHKDVDEFPHGITKCNICGMFVTNPSKLIENEN